MYQRLSQIHVEAVLIAYDMFFSYLVFFPNLQPKKILDEGRYPSIHSCEPLVLWCVYLCVEHMAEWLRRWTRDIGVWGSIPAAPVMCKSLGQTLNPHRLCPPSSNGYQVEHKIGTVRMATAVEICAALSPGRWDCERVSAAVHKKLHSAVINIV